jgi:hypothetical protein
MSKRLRAFALTLCVAVAAGSWLRWDSVYAGFFGDDYVQLSMLEGRFPVQRSIFDLYRFADVERDGNVLADAGYHPWWTSRDLRIAMCRPLSSALLALDHRLFGAEAFGYHVHSFLWWVLVLVAAGLVLFRSLPVPAASVALVLFSIDEAHTGAVIWIANRSTSVSTFFALLGLWLHLRYRDRRTVFSIGAEVAAFSLALLGGEYALSSLAYVIAYELVGREDDENQRVLMMLPAVLPTLAYFVGRKALGFGVRSSAYYIDPLEAPREFVRNAAERIPILLGESVLGMPARAFVDVPTERPMQIAWGVAALLLIGALAWWLRRHCAEPLRSATAWLALGSVLAVVPTAGALPEDRLLVASSFGVLACAAVFVAAAVRPALFIPGSARWGLPGTLTFAIALVHGLGAARVSWGRAAWFAAMAPANERWSLEADIPDDPATQVLFLSGADFTTNANLPWVREIRGASRPKHYRRLAGSGHVQEITRTAPNIIEVVVLSSDLADTMAGSLYRTRLQPLRKGQELRLEGMRVEVLRTVDGNPWRTRFTFDEPLDRGTVLLHAMPDGFRRVTLPGVGDKLRLPYPSPPSF